jgi:hypothetical protein
MCAGPLPDVVVNPPVRTRRRVDVRHSPVVHRFQLFHAVGRAAHNGGVPMAALIADQQKPTPPPSVKLVVGATLSIAQANALTQMV